MEHCIINRADKTIRYDSGEDIVLQAIENQTLTANNLTFASLRALAGIDSGLHSELARGRLMIHRQELLNQYLFSYGLMVYRQWKYLVSHMNPLLIDNILTDNILTSQIGNNKIVTSQIVTSQIVTSQIVTNSKTRLDVYDYGCGQGLATLLLMENMPAVRAKINKITLLEPSLLALTRAKHILACTLPKIPIRMINKTMDNITVQELGINARVCSMHLFSNILDIEGFDQFALFEKILTQGGIHYIIAVSNDRNCYGGTQRLQRLYNALTQQALQVDEKSAIITHAQMHRFVDNRNMNHVYFYLKIEIN